MKNLILFGSMLFASGWFWGSGVTVGNGENDCMSCLYRQLQEVENQESLLICPDHPLYERALESLKYGDSQLNCFPAGLTPGWRQEAEAELKLGY